MSDDVLIERRGAIAIITLHRPDRLNAITPSMGRAYAIALRACGHDPDVRAIVIAGAGKGFCAGADLQVLAQGPEVLESFLDEQRRDSPTLALDLPVPVVTAVHGAAAGLGLVIALASDVTILGSRARLIPAFPRLGLVAEYGIASLLLQRIGQLRTNDLLLTGRELDAETAASWGLGLGPVDDPLDAALEWAEIVARECSPTSLAVIKGQVARAGMQTRDEALVDSLELMRTSFRGPDLPEALTARAERRPVDFGPRAEPPAP